MALTRRVFLRSSVAAAAALSASKSAPSLPSGVAEKYVDVNGIRTRYFEGGTGETLVLVHGGNIGTVSYSANMWDLNLEGLSQHMHVYAVDKLGSGYTDNPQSDRDYTMEAQTRHVFDFMNTLGMTKASLIGHSRGALPVARIALEHPDRVQGLIILDSSTLAPADSASSVELRAFYARLTANAPPVPTAEYVRREPDANSYFHSHITDDYVEEILQMARLPKMLEAQEKMKRLGAQYNADIDRMKAEALDMISSGSLKAPTLILWGYNDPSAPLHLGLKLMDVLAAAQPQTQMHIVNQAGHYLCRDQVETFNRAVISFMSRLKTHEV
jgi:2-hydroxy-6-oxonona-2,4-dienedioate hydrolase